ncbi:type II toxin-antitoxin system RelE/ParE family toxin [Opitutus sp. GAS368]|uniref:type II toxin-antitoxin system RelE/ParE family toxin n=1 Tax=Opitutus sp. GAS368 TaxID=1882749 RepID=UPI00087B49A3|nr:type II toxin-antitoxin system RelE/ParE family toxin [Opitutus sp. GAS368]SDS32396.1 ParE toxin of type II toxin-antitoxin system, parDE [Opitutus sp. GAS368]
MLVRPAAEADLAAARDWYEQRRAGLGLEFLDETARALHELKQEPERPRLYYRNFRRVFLRRFPYKIFYQVIGLRIVVFRVLHAKQDHNQGLDHPC